MRRSSRPRGATTFIALLVDRPVELDLVERRRQPVRKVDRSAGVDAGPAGLDVRLDPRPGPRARERPGEPAEHTQAVGGEELVGPHWRFQSLKASTSFARVSSGISSSDSDPRHCRGRANLFHEVEAAVTEVQMELEPGHLLRRHRTLEVLGGELDDLPARVAVYEVALRLTHPGAFRAGRAHVPGRDGAGRVGFPP